MQKVSRFRSLIKGTAYVFIANVLIYFIGFLYQIPVVRILGPEKYGVWGLVYCIVSTIALLSTPGLVRGVLYFLSKNNLEYNNEKIGSVIKVAFIFIIVSTALFTVGLLIFNTYYIDKLYNYPNIKPLLYIMSLTIPLMALGRICGTIFRSFHNIDADYKIKILPDFFKLTVIPIVLIITQGNLYYLAIFNVIALFLPVIYGGYIINKLIIPLKSIFRFDSKDTLKRLVKYSWPLSLNEYILVIAKRIDIFFIAYFLNASAIGVYRVAAVFSSTLIIISIAMNYLFFPIANKLKEEGKISEYIDFTKRVFKYMIYAIIPIMCFYTLFSTNILSIIYGYRFTNATRPLIFLTVATSMSVLQSIPVNILALNEKTKSMLVISLIYIFSNITANYFLIPKYAITGAAVATLLGNLIMIMAVFLISIFLKKFVFPWKSIGVLIIGIVVVFISIYFRERSLADNIAIYSIALCMIASWGCIFEKSEIITAWNIIKNKAYILMNS